MRLSLKCLAHHFILVGWPVAHSHANVSLTGLCFSSDLEALNTIMAIVHFQTLPFFLMLLYVMKNIKLADSFVRFLIIFFVLYASVWLVGNDNLGTAVRLRMYNYLAIYISFFYILRLKIQSAEAHRL